MQKGSAEMPGRCRELQIAKSRVTVETDVWAQVIGAWAAAVEKAHEALLAGESTVKLDEPLSQA